MPSTWRTLWQTRPKPRPRMWISEVHEEVKRNLPLAICTTLLLAYAIGMLWAAANNLNYIPWFIVSIMPVSLILGYVAMEWQERYNRHKEQAPAPPPPTTDFKYDERTTRGTPPKKGDIRVTMQETENRTHNKNNAKDTKALGELQDIGELQDLVAELCCATHLPPRDAIKTAIKHYLNTQAIKEKHHCPTAQTLDNLQYLLELVQAHDPQRWTVVEMV